MRDALVGALADFMLTVAVGLLSDGRTLAVVVWALGAGLTSWSFIPWTGDPTDEVHAWLARYVCTMADADLDLLAL